MQLAGKLLRTAWRGARFAPAEAGTVVRADPRRRGDLGKDRIPIEGEPAQACIEYDGGAALSDATQVQAVATNIYQLPRRWIAPRVAGTHDRLVGRTTGRQEDDQRQ